MTEQKLIPFTLESIQGDNVPSVESFKGKPLLLLFYYLGCPGCVGRAVPFANRMALEYDKKLSVIGIHSNFEGPELANEAIIGKMNELYARFPFYRDAGLATTFHDYGAAGTPHWILADENGVILQDIFGSDPNRALLRLDLSLKELIS